MHAVTVPFLFRNGALLRPYQRDGLDWLVSMHDRRLNGILADEMGLGKTIQTISLLAHLASARCVWGPHLIVVPTSTLLNWEAEFRRWCPALKVVTYFGGVKERRAKRAGWSKPNAFHVCITSYQTVLADAPVFKRKHVSGASGGGAADAVVERERPPAPGDLSCRRPAAAPLTSPRAYLPPSRLPPPSAVVLPDP